MAGVTHIRRQKRVLEADWSVCRELLVHCHLSLHLVGSGLAATNERCYGVLTYHIDDGEIEGVDVSGLHVAVLTDSPALMLKGNWRVALVIDTEASDEQANKLETVFWGDLGGPPSWILRLMGERVGVLRVPASYENCRPGAPRALRRCNRDGHRRGGWTWNLTRGDQTTQAAL